MDINTYRAAREGRQHVQNCKRIVQKLNIIEFHDHIWNHHEKCIQISTNMPSIGSVICEIGFEFQEI